MAPAAPAPEALYARLREISGTSSDLLLAHWLSQRLGEPVDTRKLARWKTGRGIEYHTAVRLLDLAGWLKVDSSADQRAKNAERRQLVNQLRALVSRL